MSTTEKEAQKDRADRLRLRIDEIITGRVVKTPERESPRRFIDRRMKEVEIENKDAQQDSD